MLSAVLVRSCRLWALQQGTVPREEPSTTRQRSPLLSVARQQHDTAALHLSITGAQLACAPIMVVARDVDDACSHLCG